MKLNSVVFDSLCLMRRWVEIVTRITSGHLRAFNWMVEEMGVASRGKKGTFVEFPGWAKIVEHQLRNAQSTFFNFSGSSRTGFANRSVTALRLIRNPTEEATNGDG